MKASPPFAKLLPRLTWFLIGFVAVLALGLHLWFINHSEQTIEDLIAKRSNGKLKAIIKKFSINYFDNRINIKDLTIINTDSTQQSTAYRFNTKDFHLKIQSTWDFLFQRKLVVDSVIFNNPEFTILRKKTKQLDTNKNKLPLADELGNIYTAINQSLDVLNLQRFEMNDGKVIIKNADSAASQPFILSHIFFSIDKLKIDSSSVKNKAARVFPERVFLHIANQKILLQDNTSAITFKDLVLDTKEKLIRIINPSVALVPGNKTQNSLSFKADALNISGLDFEALYQQQLIKADSIFLQNPVANLEVFSNEKNKNTSRKNKLEEFNILTQLPVTVDINHIVMQHGNGLLHLHKADRTTSYETKNNNLSLVGFRLNDSIPNNLSIDGFNYTLRSYVGYTRDSIYRFHFDSLQFINDKIIVHQFSVSTAKKTQAHLIRTYTAPRFEITGLDWFSFIFANRFKATSAVLYNPVLSLEKNSLPENKSIVQTEGKKSIYQVLSVLDNMIDLDELKIVNAKLNINQGNNLGIQFKNLSLDINTKELTAAKSIIQIVHSVRQLSFDTAIAASPAAVLLVNKANFNKDKTLFLNNVTLDNTNINASLNNVAVGDFSFDNNTLEVNDVQWKNGAIAINGFTNNSTEKKTFGKNIAALFINNISGNNTTINFKDNTTKATLTLKTLTATSLSKFTGQAFQLQGLRMVGSDANVDFLNSKLQVGNFLIADKASSQLQDVLFKKNTTNDSISITAPSFYFIPFINESIASKIMTIDSVRLEHPSILIASKEAEAGTEKAASHLPPILVQNFEMEDASIRYDYTHIKNKTTASFNKLSLHITGIDTRKKDTIVFNNSSLNATAFSFKKDNNLFKSEGNINAASSLFLFYTKKNAWQIQLDKVAADSIHYTALQSNNKSTTFIANGMNATNIVATNKDVKKILPWFANQPNAAIQFDALYWQADSINIQARALKFNQPKKQLTIQSFSIGPQKDRDDFMNSLVYRKDYMQAATGEVQVNGIELKDGLWHIPFIHINNAAFNIYSNKLKPSGKETTQALPVGALKKMSLKFLIDTMQLTNMAAHYTELNAETKQTGQVDFTNINGSIKNIASQPVKDSMAINISAKFLDSMRLHFVLNQSYTDSLKGLEMQLQLGRGNLRLLNPFLSPLVSMRIHSGYLDTLDMTAFGNTYKAHGTMRLYYHTLNAGLLDSGNVQHQKAKTKLLNFFVNAFAIKNKNDSHAVEFSFIRNNQKSFISYLLAMIIHGAAKTAAPVSNVLYKKEYKKQLKKMEESTAQ